MNITASDNALVDASSHRRDRMTWSVVFNVAISLLTWARRIQVLDRCFCFPPSLPQTVALGCTVLAGWMQWIAIFSVDGDVVLQVAAGFLATCLSWVAMVTIVNDAIFVVKRRQMGALGFYAIIDLLKNVQTRFILN